jgi:hypothetical protein
MLRFSRDVVAPPAGPADRDGEGARMSWWKKKSPLCAGSVLFATTVAPRAENFAFLAKQGIRISPREAGTEAHWRLALEHPAWGAATLTCLRDVGPVPDLLIDHDPRLSTSERERARRGRISVSVSLEPRTDNVLYERKQLLRFLRAVHGDDGLAVLDHTAQAFWSRQALDEELAHDAELDILGIFTVHAVGETDRPYWMHSHGFKELGFCELCLLDPSPELARSASGWDVVRLLAFSIVEGKARLSGPPVAIVRGAPAVQLVPSASFLAERGNSYPQWAEDLDEEHSDGHGVACDPPQRRFFGLLAGTLRPWSFLKTSFEEDLPLLFSDEATELMARRARATWQVLRGLREEFAELQFPCLAKLRFDLENGGGEHLWFEVAGTGESTVDATLVNEPWNDIGIACGDRREHGLDRLTDWSIMTPAGQITPRSMTPARMVREHKDQILEIMKQAAVDEGTS